MTSERAIRELIERKRTNIKEHVYAMEEVNSMFFKEVMIFLIEKEIKEIKQLKKQLRVRAGIIRATHTVHYQEHYVDISSITVRLS